MMFNFIENKTGSMFGNPNSLEILKEDLDDQLDQLESSDELESPNEEDNETDTKDTSEENTDDNVDDTSTDDKGGNSDIDDTSTEEETGDGNDGLSTDTDTSTDNDGTDDITTEEETDDSLSEEEGGNDKDKNSALLSTMVKFYKNLFIMSDNVSRISTISKDEENTILYIVKNIETLSDKVYDYIYYKLENKKYSENVAFFNNCKTVIELINKILGKLKANRDKIK